MLRTAAESLSAPALYTRIEKPGPLHLAQLVKRAGPYRNPIVENEMMALIENNICAF